MDTAKKSGFLPWSLRLRFGTRRPAEVAARGAAQGSETPSPDAVTRVATPTVAYPAPAADGAWSGPADKVMPLLSPPPEQVLATPSPAIEIGTGPAPGAKTSVVDPAATPAPEGAAPQEASKGKDPETDDLMSLFTEDQGVNQELQRLVNGLDDVDIEALATQCRDIAARLKSRQRTR